MILSERDAFGLGVEVGDDAVPQDGERDRADVVADDVGAAVQDGARLAAEDEVLARARAGAPAHPLLDERRARRAVVTRVRRASSSAYLMTWSATARGGPSPAGSRMSSPASTCVTAICVDGRRRLDDLELLVLGRVVDAHLEHEAVELGLGQRVGAFLLDRVLRGEHEERLGQLVAHAADGDLVLLHGFEQGGLRLRRRAVDLVGEDDVGEHRALDELELARAGRPVLLDDLGAGDVGGHQVGRELDAAEVERQASGQRRDHQRLGEAGHADQQAVAAGEDRDEELVDDLVLADDDLRHLVFQRPEGLDKALHPAQIVGFSHGVPLEGYGKPSMIPPSRSGESSIRRGGAHALKLREAVFTTENTVNPERDTESERYALARPKKKILRIRVGWDVRPCSNGIVVHARTAGLLACIAKMPVRALFSVALRAGFPS